MCSSPFLQGEFFILNLALMLLCPVFTQMEALNKLQQCVCVCVAGASFFLQVRRRSLFVFITPYFLVLSMCLMGIHTLLITKAAALLL